MWFLCFLVYNWQSGHISLVWMVKVVSLWSREDRSWLSRAKPSERKQRSNTFIQSMTQILSQKTFPFLPQGSGKGKINIVNNVWSFSHPMLWLFSSSTFTRAILISSVDLISTTPSNYLTESDSLNFPEIFCGLISVITSHHLLEISVIHHHAGCHFDYLLCNCSTSLLASRSVT